MADAIGTITAWGTVAAAAAGFLAAVGPGVLALQTRRLANETRNTTQEEIRQTDLLRRDRELRLRPVVEIHDCSVLEKPDRAILRVSNRGQGLAVFAFCTCECTNDRTLASGSYISSRPVHIPPGAAPCEIELRPLVDSGLHAALLTPTPGVYSVSLGGEGTPSSAWMRLAGGCTAFSSAPARSMRGGKANPNRSGSPRCWLGLGASSQRVPSVRERIGAPTAAGGTGPG